MATKRFVYLTYLDAVEHHFDLMRAHGENRIGIFDRNLVESALARPKDSAFYEDGDLYRQAATLFFGLVKNHPWFGGNKRTASYLTEIFLELNELRLVCELSELVDACLRIEADEWKVPELEEWLRGKTEKQ